MAKGFKLLKTAVLSAASAAAITAFLRSETGKKTKKSVVKFAKEYKKDPQAKHEELVQKAQAYGSQAFAKVTELKEGYEAGDWTVDEVVDAGKSKATELKDQSLDKFDEIKNLIASQNLSTKDLIAAIKEKTARLASQEAATEQEEEPVALDETEVITIELPEADESVAATETSEDEDAPETEEE